MLGQNLFVALLAVAVLHGYFWLRLVHGTAMPQPWRTVAATALSILAISIPVTLRRPPGLGPSAARIYFLVAYGWIGLALLLLIALLLTEIPRAALWLRHRAGGSSTPRSPERRRAIGRILGGTAAALGASAAAVGAAEALALVIERVTVPLRRLPMAMSGTRIVQISDVHIGATIRREYLERVVAEVNALEPDVVAITGDLVDGPVDALRDLLEPLADLRARHGVFFVTGNHEYYYGARPWVAHLATLGIRVLRNEHVAIGDADASFDLAGVDDYNSAWYRIGHGHDPDGALAGRDPSREVVLLAHQPKSVEDAVRLGVGLQLSGHTHGGQIYPWKYLVGLDQPFVEGLHRLGGTWIYVSRGTGYWGPPMRVCERPEITEITLVSS